MAALFVGTVPLLAHEIKIGVVDVESILLQFPEHKELEKKLKEEIGHLQEESDARWKEVADLYRDIENEKHALSETGVMARQEDLIRKETELGEFWNLAAEEIQSRTEAAAQKLSKRVEQGIKEFAIESGYDLLFDRSSGKLLYSSDQFDCTDAASRIVLQSSDKISQSETEADLR